MKGGHPSRFRAIAQASYSPARPSELVSIGENLFISDFIEPSTVFVMFVQETAAGFVNTYLGSSFSAAHLRRGDFFQHCLKGRQKRVPCFHPVRQLADCLARKVQLRYRPRSRNGTSGGAASGSLFLATNAEEMELDLLKKWLQIKVLSA